MKMVNITKKIGDTAQKTIKKGAEGVKKTVKDATSQQVSETDARHVMLGAIVSPFVAMGYRKFSKWVMNQVPKKWNTVVNISSTTLPFLTAGLVKRLKPPAVNVILGTLYGVGAFNLLSFFMDLGGKSISSEEKPAEQTFQKVIGVNAGGFFPNQ